MDCKGLRGLEYFPETEARRWSGINQFPGLPMAGRAAISAARSCHFGSPGKWSSFREPVHLPEPTPNWKRLFPELKRYYSRVWRPQMRPQTYCARHKCITSDMREEAEKLRL
ncbi:hypothetical protein Y1Q_0020243 [Alligator mississippiensis]|uniref:Uncharacterized protein n=1 Tax=Alligator mississippiensis TaxID=8496 RepID=A0A151PIH8_ALLMI|nr:hypothetical protein Y1Q_0020243 [Alligator mississippiensis]